MNHFVVIDPQGGKHPIVEAFEAETRQQVIDHLVATGDYEEHQFENGDFTLTYVNFIKL